ncbi:MAG: beta strand repeat-containing protein, partial [Phycisphaeraceae bacterium JB051]
MNLTAIAVDSDPDSPAWGVVESGGTNYLVRFTRINGEIQSQTVIGAIQDSQGRNVTEIESIELESTGDLYVVATRPTVNTGGTREVFRINSNTAVASAVNVVVFADGVLNDDVTGTAIDESNGAENGVLYATVRIGTQDMLIRIDRSIAVSPSDSEADSDDGAVSDNTDGLTNDERFLFYSVYDNTVINPALISSTLDLVPQVDVDSNIEGGGDLLDAYNVTALTVTANDRLLAVVQEADGTMSLYEAQRNTTGGPIQNFTKLGSLTYDHDSDDGAVTADTIINIQALEAHVSNNNKVYFIGQIDTDGDEIAETSDMLFELTFADDDTFSITGQNVLISGATTTSSFTALAFAQNDAAELYLYGVRQTSNGDELISFATDANNDPSNSSSTIVDIAGTSATVRIAALDTYGSGTLVGYRDDESGSSVDRDLIFLDKDGTVEQRLAAGVIDSALSGLAIDADGRVYSVFSVDEGNSQMWQSESFAQIPSLEDGDSGTLADVMDVIALTIGSSGSTFIVTNNDTGFVLQQVQRDAAGLATGTESIGHIVTSGTSSSVLDITGLDINPASNGLWTIGVDASTLSPDTSLGSASELHDVIDVVVTDALDANQRQRVFAMVNNGISIDLYEITRAVDGSVEAFNFIGQLSDASGNAILAATAIESNNNDALFVNGYAADDLLQSTTVDADILSGLTIQQIVAVPGTDNAMYALTSNGDIYFIDNNGVETLIDQSTINDIQGIAFDANMQRLIVLGRVDNSTSFNLYAIDAATATDPDTLTVTALTSFFNDQTTIYNTSNSSFAGMTWDNENNQLLLIRNDIVTATNGQFLVTASFDALTGEYLSATSSETSIQNGLTEQNMTITELTLHNGTLMAIHQSGASQYMVAIDQTDPSQSRVLTSALGGDEIVGLSDNENGSLVIVTTDDDTSINSWNLGDATPTTRLYTINGVTSMVTDGGVSSTGNGTALTSLDGSIVSFAVDTDGDTTVLYAVTQSATDSLHHLITIDTDNVTDDGSVAGTINDLGVIQLNTNLQDTGSEVNPTIVSADIRNGVLVAIATGISSDVDRQIIGVSLENPSEDTIFYTIPDTLTIDETLVGLSVDEHGNLFALSSSTGVTRLMTSVVEKSLYTVSTLTGLASAVGTLNDVNGDPITDTVTAMSFSKAGDVLYAILRDMEEGQDRLVTVSMTDGEVSEIGTSSSIIQVNDENTHIVALETSPTGNLLAYDDSQAEGRRVIQINLDDTETSLQVTTPDSAINDVMGFAVDANGRYYSLADITNTTTSVTETRVFSSLNSFVAQALFNGGLGAAFDDIADLTVNAAGQIYAIRSELGGQTSLLYK